MYTVSKRMKKAIIFISCIVLIAAILYISKLNTPKAPQTTTLKAIPTVQQNSGFKDVFIEEIGLSFKYPSNLTFRKEVAEDSAGIHAVGFYIEKKVDNNLTYTLYGVYQPNIEATKQDLEKSKIGMDTNTIKEVVIGGAQGIEGLVTGPKTRYMTVLLRNNRILTISTIPPTTENKTLTDQILATFEFK